MDAKFIDRTAARRIGDPDGASASSTVSAPGRICLAGENLDWMLPAGGPSVVAALDLRIHVTFSALSPPGDLVLRSNAPLYARRRVRLEALDAYPGDVLDHLQAAAKVVADRTGVPRPGILDVHSRLPIGAGLSSSAALLLAAAGALLAAHGGRPDVRDVCAAAYAAECGELATGAGWMDFLACAAGGVSRVVAAEAPTVERLAGGLDPAVILVDTGRRPAIAQVMAGQRARYDAGEPDAVRYAEETRDVAGQLAAALAERPVDHRAAGALVQRAQALLRDRLRCSTPLIDRCVERCLRAGAYCAKISGAGHGGFMFCLAPHPAVPAILAALSPLPVRARPVPAVDRGLVFGDSPEYSVRVGCAAAWEQR